MPQRDGNPLQCCLEYHWQAYRQALNACRHRLTEHHVHALRLAIRQLLAALRLIQAVQANAKQPRLRRQLKQQLDHLNALRDNQVMQQAIAETSPHLPDLAAFARYVHQQAQSLQKDTRHFIAGIPRQTLSRKTKRLRQQLRYLPPATNITTAALQAIDRHFACVVQRYQQLDTQQPDSLHALRIALKKFRYLQLAAQPLLPPQTLAPNACKDCLALLGQLQDNAVMQRSLSTFYQGAVPETIALHLQNQRHQLLSHFEQQHASLLNAWPIQPLP